MTDHQPPLDTVRASFQWGLMVLFAAVLIDTVTEADLVNGFLVIGYFGVGLVGMALARFSSEAGDSQIMSFEWWMPITVSVGHPTFVAWQDWGSRRCLYWYWLICTPAWE